MTEDESAELDADLAKKEARASFWTRLFWLTAGLVVAAILVAVIWVVFAIRHQQVQSVQTNKQTNENSVAIKDATRKIARATRLIVSCTTPNGKCFKDGIARQAGAIGSINEVTIYAVACAASVDLPPGHHAEALAQVRICTHGFVDKAGR